jgi:hypothetical protein
LSDPSEWTSESGVELPPILRAELAGPPLPRRPWYRGIGPAYLGIFVWGPFFDPLWTGDRIAAGPAWLAAGAIGAAIVCYVSFYLPTAWWGFRARRGLPVVAASTFGALGSEWIAGLGVGVAEIVWFAVAIDWAIASTFLGLAACGLMNPATLGRWDLGPMALRTPIFLATAVFWIFITGMAALLRLAGVIAALMRVFAPVAALLLAAAAFWLLPGAPDFRAEDVRVLVGRSGSAGQGGANASIVPTVLGYFAMAGLLGVDWGAGARRSRDVVLGGLAGIVLAASATASLALLAVVGAVGRLRLTDRLRETTAVDPPPLSFRWAVVHGIGGYPAGIILILFGLAALAPACWCSWLFLRRFVTRWPTLRRLGWMWAGGAVAWLLVATSWAGRIEAIARAMGLVFAPAVGAMAGDWLRQRGGWAGLRDRVNPPGVLAWAAGLALGMAADFAAPVRDWLPPAPIAGLLGAAVVYWLLAALGLERPSIPVSAFDAHIGTEFPAAIADHDAASRQGAAGPGGADGSPRGTHSEPPTPEACREGQP